VLVETLVNYGITHVFGMVGHSNLGFADAMRRAEERGELTYIGIRHEGAAAFAASAYGKLSGRPAACFAIAGPGSTNLLTACAAVYPAGRRVALTLAPFRQNTVTLTRARLPCVPGWPVTNIERGEHQLVLLLRAGDEVVFARLIDTYTPTMQRVARTYVASREVAEDVVQDTWLAVLEGIDRFEERSSLRSWLFRILVNIAKTRGAREHRSVPMSSMNAGLISESGPTVEPSRFLPADHTRWPRHWAHPPERWPDSPERTLLSAELIALAQQELEQLPERQRAVVMLRDLADYDSDEVCSLLDLTAANQRVLLHRGRARIRQALEDYVSDAS
jgi:RNA polymerase sigma-70 factor (ECF subfamily)